MNTWSSGNRRQRQSGRARPRERQSGTCDSLARYLRPIRSSKGATQRTRTLKELRHNVTLYPYPSKILNREHATIIRRTETGTPQSAHLRHYFSGNPGTSTFPYCGAYHNQHQLWTCPNISNRFKSALSPVPAPFNPDFGESGRLRHWAWERPTGRHWPTTWRTFSRKTGRCLGMTQPALFIPTKTPELVFSFQ